MTDPRIAVLSALSSPGWHPVPEAHGMPWDEAEQLLAAYDASRAAAAPSAPADRAAILREAADTVDAMNEGCSRRQPCGACDAREDAADSLRRMAAEPAAAGSAVAGHTGDTQGVPTGLGVDDFARMFAGADVIAGRAQLPFDQLPAEEQERHRQVARTLLNRAQPAAGLPAGGAPHTKEA
jgi:cytochrome c556